MDKLVEQLNNLGKTKAGGKAREAWVLSTRESMLAHARQDAPAAEKTGSLLENFSLAVDVSTGWSKAFRPVVAAMVIVFLVFGSWTATVSASFGSLPGDALYGVKLFSEGAQITLSPAREVKTKLRIDFAGRRLEEATKLIEKPDIRKEEKLTKSMADFKKGMKTVQDDLEEIKQKSSSKKAVEVAKIVDEKSEEFENKLQETMDKLSDVNKNDVQEAKAVVEVTAVKAVEVIVEKHAQGQAEGITEEEVIEKITSKLERAEAAAALVGVTSASGTAEVISTPVGSEAASSTGEVITGAASGTGEVIGVTGASTATADQLAEKVVEARELLENNDLVGAIAAVKEVNTLASAVGAENQSEASETPIITEPVGVSSTDPIIPVIQTSSTPAVAGAATTTKAVTN
ncbi:MAG: DUF5667 domain-containing protein [Patescibacteria group bacterium]|nr:DUF5667 domain-containing protein [Patescibacteria group bacterium]